MSTCKECIHEIVCDALIKTGLPWADGEYPAEAFCLGFKGKNDLVEVVRCKDCKFSRPLDKSKSPEKYFKNSCVVCECENVVGDEPMIYINTHFCSYGERKDS
jgi:hypothetical protein